MTRRAPSTTSMQILGRVTHMGSVKGRAHRSAGAATVLLQGRVPPDVRDLARTAADEAGISIASYLEALVRTDAEQHYVRPAQPYTQEELLNQSA